MTAPTPTPPVPSAAEALPEWVQYQIDRAKTYPNLVYHCAMGAVSYLADALARAQQVARSETDRADTLDAERQRLDIALAQARWALRDAQRIVEDSQEARHLVQAQQDLHAAQAEIADLLAELDATKADRDDLQEDLVQAQREREEEVLAHNQTIMRLVVTGAELGLLKQHLDAQAHVIQAALAWEEAPPDDQVMDTDVKLQDAIRAYRATLPPAPAPQEEQADA